mmetsp:Transcript_24714/g.43547  ORF Transcript_24714/g.43547 Transcript_24714/m.43547 type:complete len:158 (-) Transcript_24714:909-1382(-)
MTLNYDETMHPTCLNLQNCSNPHCRYSHEEPQYMQTVLVPKDCAKDPQQLFDFLFPDEGLSIEGDVNDMIMTDQLLEEMSEFEKGPNEEMRPVCQFWLETGFCLFKANCPFAHDEEAEVKYQRSQEWYPSSSECDCCRGYIFGCKASSCRERCQTCQ